MALQNFGGSIYYPPVPSLSLFANAGSTSQINATGKKSAFIGRVATPDFGAKSIRKIGFRVNNVTSAGGSVLTISLQDVSSSSSPLQPDGSQDQTVAVALSALAGSTWYTTGNLSADRAVSYGDWIAVVVEYDGSGRLGADQVAFNTYAANVSAGNYHQLSAMFYGGASWATESNMIPSILFEFSDGTFGKLVGSPGVYSALTTLTYNSSSSPDEYGIAITPEFGCKVIGAWVNAIFSTNSSDAEVILYSGTTALKTTTVDANMIGESASGSNSRLFFVPFSSEQELTAGETYYLSFRPTTANNVGVSYFSVSTANHMTVWPGSTSIIQATRTNQGAWSTTTTTRPMMGLEISALEEGGAAAGVGAGARGGMCGGFVN